MRSVSEAVIQDVLREKHGSAGLATHDLRCHTPYSMLCITGNYWHTTTLAIGSLRVTLPGQIFTRNQGCAKELKDGMG